jgi:hypothetical protein
VRRFFSAQAELEFPLHVGQHCLRCPHYRELCPAKLSTHAAGDGDGRAAEIADAPPAPPQTPHPPAKRPKSAPGAGQLSLPFQDEDG